MQLKTIQPNGSAPNSSRRKRAYTELFMKYDKGNCIHFEGTNKPLSEVSKELSTLLMF